MKGGVILYRGAGTAARRYLETDRSTADDYYLEARTALAEFTATDATGEVIDARTLDPEQYAAWVDWIDPVSGTSMGTPRAAGEGSRGSPRFAEMVINAPKSLSIAAALHTDVSDALDITQRDAAAEIRRWLARNSVTRVGPRDAREIIPVEQLQTVAVTHKTSRAGDPHRHIHFQISTRVVAAGKWRALDTAALFKQQGAIRALGTAVIAAHPQLARVLDAHGLTLDPVSGEVVELQRSNHVLSKRARQVERNLDRLENDWEQAHPGETPGPVVQARLLHKAWALQRPSKKPSSLGSEVGWRAELEDAGYNPAHLTKATRSPIVGLDDLSIQEVASRALDRCAAGASAWTVHTIREHVTRITTEHGVTATPEEVREFVQLATDLAQADCFSVLPEHAARPDHVAHLTSLHVIEAETRLRDLLTDATPEQEPQPPDVAALPSASSLDPDQVQAAAAIASTDPLVIVEGAAGSGKTTMLRPAITATQEAARRMRVVAPTKKAAHVAGEALGIPADSVAALVHAHGFRWNRDGVWTRLTPGQTDPETGRAYTGPPGAARLEAGERVVVDEAGMLDQDTAIALLTVTTQAGATVALIGDRAQLPAVGRGGVLDIAAQIRGTTIDMTGLHRFKDAAYADLTLHLRDGTDPGRVFDKLQEMGLVRLHHDEEALREHIASNTAVGDAITTSTNDDANELNARIQAERLDRGEIDHTRTVTGSDGLDIGVGDVIQARKNDSAIGIANRQTFTVQHFTDDGMVFAVENGDNRKRRQTVRLPAEYVTEHAHLAYASTAYGVQGVTVARSHTVLDESINAAGLYVGLTRGTHHNTLHLIAENDQEAREQFVTAMSRDRSDRGLDAATPDAYDAVRGSVKNGPVAFVNAERTRLRDAIRNAEQHAHAWDQAITALGELRQRHEAEREELDKSVITAEQAAADIRSEVVQSLLADATADAGRCQHAVTETRIALRTHDEAGWLRKRSTARQLEGAQQRQRDIENNVRVMWGSLPTERPDATRAWDEAVADRRAAADPRVVDAEQVAAEARTFASKTVRRHVDQRMRAHAHFFTQIEDPRTQPHGGPESRRDRWHAHSAHLQEQLNEIEAVPPEQAARLIRVRQEDAQRQAQHARERADRLGTPEHTSPYRSELDHGLHR